MGKSFQRIVCVVLALIIILSLVISALAVSPSGVQSAEIETGNYILKKIASPQIGSVGGEWAAIGLARSGNKTADGFFRSYYSAVESELKACGGSLSDKKYTEYSRVILALTAMGKSPSNVGVYNLLTPLGDYYKTVWQGINGPIFALIALDSGKYDIPKNTSASVQASRDMYVEKILSLQLPDGGFAMTGTSADPDTTAMGLQALSKYLSRMDVKASADKALDCLSALQNEAGGFGTSQNAYSESVSQTIIALGELGISLDDSRFIKDGHSLADALLSYEMSGGGFRHLPGDSSPDEMATEQALCALTSASRSGSGQKTLYDMSDAVSLIGDGSGSGSGLSGKNADVKTPSVINSGVSFLDLPAENPHKNRTAILSLASRGIISGMGDGTFAPESTMTRAQFSAIVVKALGLVPKASGTFADVAVESWYAPYVGTACTYGIVSGRSATSFDPEGTITRQEAAVMAARAAKLCGMDTTMTASAIRDTLAQFSDYTKSADWAQASLAFCYSKNILDTSDTEIQPAVPVTRGAVAQMLLNMLGGANLLSW